MRACGSGGNATREASTEVQHLRARRTGCAFTLPTGPVVGPVDVGMKALSWPGNGTTAKSMLPCGHSRSQRTQAMCQNESRHTVRRVSNGVGNRLALGPRSRYQKLNHDLDPSAWYKATDGFGPSRTDAQADQALCFPVLCGDTCMRVWSSKHRGLSARRAALPWNLAFWLCFTTATRPARY